MEDELFQITLKMAALRDALQEMVDVESHDMRCSVVGNGCTCGAAAQRAAARSNAVHILRSLYNQSSTLI